MTRPPFRQGEEARIAQIRALAAAAPFHLSPITREEAIALVARGEAKLDLKTGRLTVSFSLKDATKVE